MVQDPALAAPATGAGGGAAAAPKERPAAAAAGAAPAEASAPTLGEVEALPSIPGATASEPVSAESTEDLRESGGGGGSGIMQVGCAASRAHRCPHSCTLPACSHPAFPDAAGAAGQAAGPAPGAAGLPKSAVGDAMHRHAYGMLPLSIPSARSSQTCACLSHRPVRRLPGTLWWMLLREQWRQWSQAGSKWGRQVPPPPPARPPCCHCVRGSGHAQSLLFRADLSVRAWTPPSAAARPNR